MTTTSASRFTPPSPPGERVGVRGLWLGEHLKSKTPLICPVIAKRCFALTGHLLPRGRRK